MTPTADQIEQWAREIVCAEVMPMNDLGTIQLSKEQLHRLVLRAIAEQEPVAWIDPRDLKALADYSRQCQVVLYRDPSIKRVPLRTSHHLATLS